MGENGAVVLLSDLELHQISINTKRKNGNTNKLKELSMLRYIEMLGAPGRRHLKKQCFLSK